MTDKNNNQIYDSLKAFDLNQKPWFLKGNKYLSYDDAKLKILEIRKIIRDLQGPRRLISNNLNNKASYNLFYNFNLSEEINLKTGLPRFPDKYYRNNGWKSWFDFLSCHKLNTHYFENPNMDFKYTIDVKNTDTNSLTSLPSIDYPDLKNQIKKLIVEFNKKTKKSNKKSEQIIDSKNSWKFFYKNYSMKESWLGSLLSLENFFKGEHEPVKDFKDDIKMSPLWRGWPELLGIERIKRTVVDKNNQFKEVNLKKKYDKYEVASYGIQEFIKRIKLAEPDEKIKPISTIDDWKKFYKNWSDIFLGDGEYELEIPYRPDLEKNYQDVWISYLHFTGQSFFDMHSELVREFSIYDFDSYMLIKYSRLADKPDFNFFCDEHNLFNWLTGEERKKNLNKNLDILTSDTLSLSKFQKEIFEEGFSVIDNYYNLLKSLTDDSNKIFKWYCKKCKKSFNQSVCNLLQDGKHKDCVSFKLKENSFFCIKCEDVGIIPDITHESFRHCDCEIGLSQEDHPDNFPPLSDPE